MAQDVLCEVSNCVHNDEDNKCMATSIYVISQAGNQAFTQEETDCQTFEPKH